MKLSTSRIVASLFAVVTLVLLLTACGHEHEWTNATCTAPKTCATCDATEGKALGHNYVDATCTTPKTCQTCGETSGDALGHNYASATCTEPKTCETCGVTIGKALGHNYTDATCTEPKTCKTCSTIDGSALGHDINTKTSKCKNCGIFEYNIEYAVRGAVKSTTDFANYIFDSYEILNIYYVLDDACTCDDCKGGVYVGDPYLTVIVFLEYTIDDETDVWVDVTGVHKLYDAVADTHYNLGYNLQDCYYRYRDDNLTEIYAADYSYYYGEDDLIRIAVNKVIG